MNYNWTFSDLMVTAQGDLSNVVVSVNFRLGAVEGSRVAYHRQMVEFTLANPEDFVDFSAITESLMISFVEQSLGDELDAIKQQLADQLSAPPVESRPLPWLATKEAYQ